jgi:putative NADH-flavin reductase
MRLIVFGASGGTGRAVLAAAETATAFVRDPAALDGRDHVVTGSVLDPAQVEAAIRGHDVVISALGTRPWRHQDICSEGTRVIATAMAAAGVRRLLCVSSQGVGDSRLGTAGNMFGFVLRRSFRDKAAMEQMLEATDLDWTVVRPGMLTNGAARGRWRAAEGGDLVGGKIARTDVAAFMLEEATANEWVRRRPTLVW